MSLRTTADIFCAGSGRVNRVSTTPSISPSYRSCTIPMSDWSVNTTMSDDSPSSRNASDIGVVVVFNVLSVFIDTNLPLPFAPSMFLECVAASSGMSERDAFKMVPLLNVFTSCNCLGICSYITDVNA